MNLEIDGPRMAWFEGQDGVRHVYKVYGYIAKTPAEALSRLNALLNAHRATGIVVYRRRPVLEQVEDRSGVYWWKVTTRHVVLPYYSVEPLPEKPEFEPIQSDGFEDWDIPEILIDT